MAITKYPGDPVTVKLTFDYVGSGGQYSGWFTLSKITGPNTFAVSILTVKATVDLTSTGSTIRKTITMAGTIPGTASAGTYKVFAVLKEGTSLDGADVFLAVGGTPEVQISAGISASAVSVAVS